MVLILYRNEVKQKLLSFKTSKGYNLRLNLKLIINTLNVILETYDMVKYMFHDMQGHPWLSIKYSLSYFYHTMQ